MAKFEASEIERLTLDALEQSRGKMEMAKYLSLCLANNRDALIKLLIGALKDAGVRIKNSKNSYRENRIRKIGDVVARTIYKILGTAYQELEEEMDVAEAANEEAELHLTSWAIKRKKSEKTRPLRNFEKS